MPDGVSEDIDDVLPPEPNGELVQWMEPRPLTVGATGISLATAGAFALGALATLTVLGLMRWLGPEREIVVGRRRRTEA